MRSDRDKRTETEHEIDEFLAKFENPADELSADYSTYLNEDNTTRMTAAQTFHWKSVDSPDLKNIQESKPSESKSEAAGPDVKESAETAAAEKEAVINKEAKDGEAAEEAKEAVRNERPASKKTSGNQKKKKKKSKGKNKAAQKTPSPDTGASGVSDTSSANNAAANIAASTKKTSKKPSKKSKPKKEKGRVKRFLFLKKNKNYDPSQGATYVKNGKTIKNKEYKFSFLKLFADLVAVGLICVMAGLIYALAIITVAPKYDYKDIYSAVDTSSTVYNDEGKQIDNVFYTENRKIVKYEDMPEDLINAFVAIEDKTFWKHHGFNWTRMIGAVLSSFTGSGRISGTSTITQQLARNVYLADTKSVRSIKRKLLEMYYASRLEHSLSKEEIIEAYLNTIYLGHGCYGVNAAAKTYFSKSVKKLDLVECAALAALPQSPDTYALLKLGSEAQDVVDSMVVSTEPATVVTNDIARDRRQLTLDLMLAQKYIDQDEYDAAYDLKLNDFIDPNLSSSSSIYSYFHEYLVDTIISDLMDQLQKDCRSTRP